jgi:hypothetical protein
MDGETVDIVAVAEMAEAETEAATDAALEAQEAAEIAAEAAAEAVRSAEQVAVQAEVAAIETASEIVAENETRVSELEGGQEWLAMKLNGMEAAMAEMAACLSLILARSEASSSTMTEQPSSSENREGPEKTEAQHNPETETPAEAQEAAVEAPKNKRHRPRF